MTTDYFDNYFFTANATGYVCPGFGSFLCKPPNACARDPNTGTRYCCDYNNVCWGLPTTCATDGSTLDCGSGTYTWCCLDKTEICTGTKGQINICWSSAHDTLTNISAPSLNQTYSSLSAAKPSASSYTFDPVALIKATATSSTSTSTSSPSSSATSTGSTAISSSPTTSPSPSLSGGAIAGIVIGAIAGLALLAVGIYLVIRHNKRRNAPHQGALYEADANTQPDAQKMARAQQAPQELPGGVPMSEMQGSHVKLPSATPPQELAANSPVRNL